MYLPHTWAGEANLQEYNKTLKDVDRNKQDIKEKYQNSVIIAGMDVQVDVKPRQGPFVGDGKECLVENTTRYSEMEGEFESLLMEWVTKHEVKLANTSC